MALDLVKPQSNFFSIAGQDAPTDRGRLPRSKAHLNRFEDKGPSSDVSNDRTRPSSALSLSRRSLAEKSYSEQITAVQPRALQGSTVSGSELLVQCAPELEAPGPITVEEIIAESARISIPPLARERSAFTRCRADLTFACLRGSPRRHGRRTFPYPTRCGRQLQRAEEGQRRGGIQTLSKASV